MTTTTTTATPETSTKRAKCSKCGLRRTLLAGVCAECNPAPAIDGAALVKTNQALIATTGLPDLMKLSPDEIKAMFTALAAEIPAKASTARKAAKLRTLLEESMASYKPEETAGEPVCQADGAFTEAKPEETVPVVETKPEAPVATETAKPKVKVKAAKVAKLAKEETKPATKEKPAKAPKVEKPATEKPAAKSTKPEISDFMMFVGGTFYTKEDFIAEAAKLGISKRMPGWTIPADLQIGKSRIWLAAGGTRKGDGTDAEVFGHFTPDMVEFIAGEDGAKTFADILAAIKKLDHYEVVTDITKEPKRMCGHRVIGGAYLATKKVKGTKDATPLVLLPKVLPYAGHHFRGLMRLTPEQKGKLDANEGFGTLVHDKCMECFADMMTAPDGAMRAARERRRMETAKEAGSPIGMEELLFILRCPDCLKKARDEKRAAKEAAKGEETKGEGEEAGA